MTRLPSFFLFFAFLQPTTGFNGIIATKPVPTRLQYQDDKHSEQSTQKPATLPTLPVMGPFLNQPSLMIGAEMTLRTPTPLQWQSLEESFYRHQQHLSEQDQSGISEAPLVAILDQTNDMSHPGSQGRYATIAAVVGVSSLTGNIDATDDNSAFMESIAGTRALIDTAKVRLVGVGRAVLKEFLYQVPTRLAQMDDEGHLLTLSEDDDEEEPPVNVIVAQFSLINDVLSNQAVSPTHAVTKMGRLANQVEWLHQDRRNLVAGIKAAKARLEKAEKALLEDHDGLGLLFGEASIWQEEFELEQPKKKSKTKKKKSRSPAEEKDRDSSTMLSKPSTNKPDDIHSPVLHMENYGLGSSASSLTGLKEMTQVLLEKLAPYYSPKRCASEEHYYEVFSFVAVLATDRYVQTSDLAWSLRCVNTEQRLQRTYDWMTAHVNELKKEADRVSRALQECGEECTDLF